MAHSFHQNFGHLIFRADSVAIQSEDLERMHAYMSGVARQLGVEHPIIGGTENHVHILGDFPMTAAVADIVRSLKTGVTHWLHTQKACYRHFSWNQGYGYFSISASVYPRMADYIRHQQEHHARITVDEEYERFIRKHTGR